MSLSVIAWSTWDLVDLLMSFRSCEYQNDVGVIIGSYVWLEVNIL